MEASLICWQLTSDLSIVRNQTLRTSVDRTFHFEETASRGQRKKCDVVLKVASVSGIEEVSRA